MLYIILETGIYLKKTKCVFGFLNTNKTIINFFKAYITSSRYFYKTLSSAYF